MSQSFVRKESDIPKLCVRERICVGMLNLCCAFHFFHLLPEVEYILTEKHARAPEMAFWAGMCLTIISLHISHFDEIDWTKIVETTTNLQL